MVVDSLGEWFSCLCVRRIFRQGIETDEKGRMEGCPEIIGVAE